ncbi:metallopeptidase TldD-related protein [Parabacteroides sp. AM08-6]|uniref:metallopeptidase TldD-related protein n=1 Tax=Parabacteroides sp. AM08-6 TaxID=2292053 RepID=UPI001314AB3D|nr:metallopeptidase TldD-related protein [Parabacteroides sp. AM08-6]
MKKLHLYIGGMALMLSTGTISVAASTPEEDPISKSIQTEIQRGMEGLKLDNVVSPCFIDYRMNALENLNIKAIQGALVFSNSRAYYNGMANVLVGDYAMNNLNFVASFRDLYNYNYPNRMVYGNDDQAIRTELWRILDGQYKNAAERYNNKLSILKQTELPEEEKNIPDFQQMNPVKAFYPAQPLKYDMEKLNEYIKEASRIFAGNTDINDSHVRIYAGSADVRYCNSEGSVCRYPNNLIALFIYTRGKTADGQEIAMNNCYPYDSFDDIPSLDELKEMCRQQAKLMHDRITAPQIEEAYVGPVLFEGEAVADLVGKLLVNNDNGIIAQRKPIATPEIKMYYSGNSAITGNALEGFMNKKVISRNLSLESMSGTEEYNGKRLFGYYPVDAQGVTPDKNCPLIQDGVLVNMLTSRTPTLKLHNSNGHARATIDGRLTGIYPGVLRLSGKQTVSDSELRKKLIDAAKEEDYSYAYIIRKLDNDTPVQIYRVNVADGSETLIRGAIMKDLMLRSLKRVSGVSDKEIICNRIYNDVKTSYIIPSAILLEEVDIVKNNKIDFQKPYVVSRPE